MAVEFCPKCENILIPERQDNQSLIVKCHHCGFSKNSDGKKLIEKEKIIHKKTGYKISEEGNEFADYKALCDRLLILFKGELIKELYSDEIEEINVKKYALGGKQNGSKAK